MGGFSYLHGGTLLYEDELGRVPPELLERFRESLVTKFADASAIAQHLMIGLLILWTLAG